jgi:sugar/nucleoside kinase (ribokinase family)
MIEEPLDLVIIGHLAVDKILFEDRWVSISGGALFYSSIGAILFNKNLGIAGRMGLGYPTEALKPLKITWEGIKKMSHEKCDLFYCISSKSNKRNNSLHDELNAGSGLCFEDIPKRFFNSKWVHIATMNPHKQIDLIKKIKEVSNAKISIDTHLDFIEKEKKVLERVIVLANLIFVNESENKLLDLNGKDRIIKKGGAGAIAIIGGKEYSVNAPKVTVVDTTGTGCGDVLAGAFLGQVAKGREIKESLNNAVILASKKCTKLGAEHLLKVYG